MTPTVDTFGGLTRETFYNLPTEKKLDVLFDLLIDQCGECKGQIGKLKRGRRVDTTIAGLMGLAGGFLAELAAKLR